MLFIGITSVELKSIRTKDMIYPVYAIRGTILDVSNIQLCRLLLVDNLYLAALTVLLFLLKVVFRTCDLICYICQGLG